MSYNIDSVDAKVLDAWMTAKDVVELADECDTPEDSFLDDLYEPAKKALLEGKPEKRLQLRRISWRGEGSGGTFEDIFAKQVAPKIMGRVEAICIWERGDSQSAFAIDDGVFQECEVVTRIVRRTGQHG